MNSDKMKSCLATDGVRNENRSDRQQISFKANQIGIKELPLNSRTYETPILH